MNHPIAAGHPTDTYSATVTAPTAPPPVDVDHTRAAEARISTDPVALIRALGELLLTTSDHAGQSNEGRETCGHPPMRSSSRWLNASISSISA